MYRFVILAAIVTGAIGQVQKDGTCNLQPGQVVTDIDIRGMIGTWYQYQRIPNTDEKGDCSTTTYGVIDYTKGSVTNTEVVDGVERSWEGTIIRESVNDPSGRFIITYDGVSTDTYVLATDYTSYALIYSCKNTSDNTKNVWAWLLSRERKFVPSYDAIQAIIAAAGRNPDVQDPSWKLTRQDNC